MRNTRINNRWSLNLPDHRAIRYLEEGMWERERIASMWLNIAPSDVIYDIGAEEGDMSALFASWVPDGGVLLVEPNPKVWPCIRAVWEMNALPSPLGWFVGFCAGDAHYPDASDVDDIRMVDGWPRCAHGQMIPAHGFRHLAEQADVTPRVPLDHIDAPPPNVITIDVEGAELEVLRGAQETLRDARPLVWVSIHPAFMRDHFDQTPAELFAYMRDLDYDAHHLADDHESHWLFQPR